jgi:hypothetical protein
MKVVENDRVISGMLHSELKRCREMFDGLEKSILGLPKGVLSERKKRYKNKAYYYFSLKYRNGKHVINKHVPKDKVPSILSQIKKRKKFEKELLSYKKRIAYLSKVIRVGR